MSKATKGLPREVVVGPHHYKLTVDSTAIAKASHNHDAPVSGLTDKDKLTVVIDPVLARSQMAAVITHESLHALMALVGADMDLGEEREEQLVRRLAPALLDFLRRNPTLVAWLVFEEV